ncbi:retrovirus-related Pol polyprotein from type-2 retrotransposable element R2DM [Elysia marginata]|uniref:Retrovirus-related Pol polyprotein from type-2 retrotransposable element R2DM n=1 Tax=Elysia marginata TaxID=1093978 RepID=A0AAV4IX63_9GAST|nr:retrovirus-related Pol polyprotein from type-2 retrotransposable element R2DM [Elysia marginata]
MIEDLYKTLNAEYCTPASSQTLLSAYRREARMHSHSHTHVSLLFHRLTYAECHRRIQWIITSVLEDLDYADDLGLLSHRYQDIQEKTDDLCEIGSKIRLKNLERHWPSTDPLGAIQYLKLPLWQKSAGPYRLRRKCNTKGQSYQHQQRSLSYTAFLISIDLNSCSRTDRTTN